MVERVVYVGASTQLIIRLLSGESLQAMLPSRASSGAFDQGTPVSVHLPSEALRVLAPSKALANEPADQEMWG
jgi:hypothetical protein